MVEEKSGMVLLLQTDIVC